MTADFLLDNSAFSRIRTEPRVAASVRAHVMATMGGLRSVLIQRTEICVSSRNVTEFDSIMRTLAALPMLESDTADVRVAAASLQRSLVRAGTHRGPKVIDLLFAATALVHDVTVLHYDADYDRLCEVEPALRARWVVARLGVIADLIYLTASWALNSAPRTDLSLRLPAKSTG